MSVFTNAANAALRNINTWEKKIQGASAHKWDMDQKAYINIFDGIETVLSEGGAIGVAKKEIFQIVKDLITENPAAESELKAFRAPIGRLFKDKAFGVHANWAHYVEGFSTQDAFREFHRKTTEPTEPISDHDHGDEDHDHHHHDHSHDGMGAMSPRRERGIKPTGGESPHPLWGFSRSGPVGFRESSKVKP